MSSDGDVSFFDTVERFNRGLVLRFMGQPKKSLELIDKVDVENFRKRGYHYPMLNTIMVRGIAQAEIGRIEKGLATKKEAVDISDEFQMPVRLGGLYNSMGYCLGEIYNYEKASFYNQKGVAVSKKLMEQFPVVVNQFADLLDQSHVNLIENTYEQGDLVNALRMIKGFEQESKSEVYHYIRHQRETRMNYLLAKIMIGKDEIDKAEIIINRNLIFTAEGRMKKREGGLLHLAGKIQMLRNDLEKAVEILQNSITILEKVGNPKLLWEAYSSLANAYKKLWRKSDSNEAWGAAKKWINVVGDGLSDVELKNGFLNSSQIKAILSKTVP